MSLHDACMLLSFESCWIHALPPPLVLPTFSLHIWWFLFNHHIPDLSLRAFSIFGFSFAHSCFFFCVAFSIGPNCKAQIIRSGSCLSCFTLYRPEVYPCFGVIFSFCRLKPFRLTMKFFSSLLTSCSRLRVGSGEFVVSSWQFCCAVCFWENEFIFSFVLSQCFFRVDSSKMNFWCFQLFQIFQICCQKRSFPNSTRDQLIDKRVFRLAGGLDFRR